MGIRIRITPAGLLCLCVAVAGGVVLLVVEATTPDESAARRPIPITVALGNPAAGAACDERGPIEDGGLAEADAFLPPIHDPSSLRELRQAVAMRGRLGLAVLQAEYDGVRLPFRAPKEQVTAASRLLHRIGMLDLYEGRLDEAAACFRKAMELGRPVDIPACDRAQRIALLGIIALRQGPAGAREAVKRFAAYLAEWPDDIRVRWLLNLAYRELGEYPDRVPREYLILPEASRNWSNLGRFEDVAARAGLAVRGPNLAGGSLFDDLDGDGRPDLLITSLDAERGAALFRNRGDGTFEDRSERAGLAEQVYACNVVGADYDNDGDLDVLLLRGGGEMALRLSLLRNRGDGTFEDVTAAAGLAEPIASGAAAWGDYDDDGRLDLFVCGEDPPTVAGASTPGPSNRCRLYRNRPDGTFVDVAEAAGVAGEHRARGAAWGDYDDDGRLDLHVTSRDGPGHLYHNEGDGTFRDRAAALGVTGPGASCWFWDHDNDGRLDLYVDDPRVSLADEVGELLGRRNMKAGHPRLYRNVGADGFLEVSESVRLDRPLPALGSGFGDVDNDGFLDLYIGTGWRSFSGLVPDRMLHSFGHFEDVTVSTGTGSLRDGNSVSFADYDGDGDLDLFVQRGGAVPGDPAENLLYRNPGQGRHWLKLKLVGTTTNRSAIGARVRVDLAARGGRTRSIHRTIGLRSSTGGNSLIESIGLRDATHVQTLMIRWPTSRTTQTLQDLAADQLIEIVEGVDSYRVLQPRPSSMTVR